LPAALYLHLRVTKFESLFSRANPLSCRLPSDDIRIGGVNNLGIAYFHGSMIIKDLGYKVMIPLMCIIVPKIRDNIRHIRDSKKKFNVVMNFLPDGTPRCGPNAGLTIVNLNDAIINKDVLDLKD
jgi:hypothetical protein